MEPIIRVAGLGKKYVIRHQARKHYDTLRDTLADGARRLLRQAAPPAKEEFWALRDVSFAVQPGDKLGIIGRNGAGKTTLLKVLSRITEPSTGRVEIRGRVASLLEVGTGFHPELTGRENIFLNGAILGMRRREIARKFDEIVAFAEVEQFLDTPVKRYSSGMYVRLAFAVAAHLESEILVVDEVLAVGDEPFQKKCLGKMKEVGSDGRTVLFVSHNMSAIQKLCNRCLVLQGGHLWLEDSAPQAVHAYLNDFSACSTYQKTKNANGHPSVISASLEQSSQFPHSEMIVLLEISSAVEKNISIDLRLSDGAGGAVGFGSLGALCEDQLCELKKGIQKIAFSFPTENLAVGLYFVSIDLTEPDHEYYDRIENCLVFEVTRPPSPRSRRVLAQSWGYGSIQFPLKLVNGDGGEEKK